MGRGPEGEISFWIQFAEVWKSLAELAEPSKREECLNKAAACLRRANTIRQRTTARLTPSTKARADETRLGGKAGSKAPSQ